MVIVTGSAPPVNEGKRGPIPRATTCNAAQMMALSLASLHCCAGEMQSAFDFTCETAGTYYIQVTGEKGHSGHFRLKVNTV